jgi:hypothetical protein
LRRRGYQVRVGKDGTQAVDFVADKVSERPGRWPDLGQVERTLPPLPRVWADDDTTQAVALYGQGLSLADRWDEGML